MIDPLAPPREWSLDPDGFVEIEALRAALPTSATGAAWFSSDERKALATAQRLTDSAVRPIPELGEAQRSSFVEDRAAFAEAVSRGLRHPAEAALPGWEPLERTRRRVADAALAIVGESRGDVVLVGHGTAWTLLVSEIVGEPLPQDLPPTAMPDLLVLDLSTRSVARRWGRWRSRSGAGR